MLKFTSLAFLTNHKRDCNSKAPNKICLPADDDKWLHFKSYYTIMRVPFVAYADFECILSSVSSCYPCGSNSFTCPRQKHDVMSFCIVLVFESGEKFDPIIYGRKDVMSVFISKDMMITKLNVFPIVNSLSLNTLTIIFPSDSLTVSDSCTYHFLNLSMHHPGLNFDRHYMFSMCIWIWLLVRVFSLMKKLNKECLPPKEAFYSSLTEEDISDAEHGYAQSMWKKFNSPP
ncbi:hypothetical protein J437_LFUL005246 [Ladona fulva]|uniref:Uncharacterized protein n=1 Tax=Ladona fulva TaxID=123851 RepID=A0A8K0JX86_LADFU|nr:hypothetical protein J437_LFUL005246 [Ladona fulva]